MPPLPRSAPVSVKEVTLSPADPADVRRQKLARIILDSMYQFLGLLDVEGNVIEINQSALDGAGIELAEVVGKPFWEARWWALSEDTRARVRAMIAEARSGRFVRGDMEIFGEARGNETIVVDFSLTPILGNDGQVAFLLPEGRNISEKIAIEAELTRRNSEVRTALDKLREIDGFKTKFFANVSHELRTPLTLILGPLNQLMQETPHLGARDHFRLSTIQRNAQALLQQVNELLDLARIDAGEMPLIYVCADGARLIREVADGFAAMAEEQGISLELGGEAEFYLDIDQAKFVRVVTNLLANAFKFTNRGGRIRCSLQRLMGNRCLLSVQDTGPGIPNRLKKLIFDRYAQGADELSASGSGLGLNIVKEFVELHRGTISVLDAPERGAIFQVELPVRAPRGAFVRLRDSGAPAPHLPGPGTPPPPTAPALPGSPTGPRVLVVEDNPDLRQFLHDVLADDYGVTLASGGEAALAILHTLSGPGRLPDLIITDLMMPEMDGERLVQEIRSRYGSPVPILVLSARADDALRARLLDNFVQDYLTKPFSPQELRARVHNLVTVKRTVEILQRELNSQASDISELTEGLIASRKSLLDGMRALQISERRWQGFYENTAVGIALLDTGGKIMKANPALQRMLGYGPAEITGLSLIDLTEESERAMTRSNVHSLLQGVRESYQIQKRYECKDGRYLWANVCASVIPVVDREGPRVAVIVEDVSAQKQAEDALAQTQANLARVSRLTAMGELVATIAHEVNQPLAAIVTNGRAALRWLEREEPDHAEVAAALHRVYRDATHAGQVIARIRGFLKKEGLKREPVVVRTMVESLLQMLQRTLSGSLTTVEVQLTDDLPVLTADPVQLQQVLLNLLVNAMDAMKGLLPQGKRAITLEAARDPAGGVRFSVRDAGPGIPPDRAAHIFEPFYSTKPEGLGMGLAISKSIVEHHGGELRLAATGVGGTCFTFTIPEETP